MRMPRPIGLPEKVDREISGAGFKPVGWKHRTIQVVRREALRLVGKVTKSARQLTLQVRASLSQIERLQAVRRQIYQLA